MKKLTTEDFIKKAREVHGDEYDYSQVEYVNKRTKVKIICNYHGEFEQTPDIHLNQKSGCPKCGIEKNTSQRSSNTVDFIEKANKVHNNRYDYSVVNYINNYTKIKIICQLHGEFLQIPNHHLQGCGCPKCKSIISKGELQVQTYIQMIYKGNILLNDRKTILNPETNRYLELDIYLPDAKLAIEYNGKHWHERPDVIVKDNIKKQYCKQNGIYLMVIDDRLWRTDKNYREIIKITLKNLLK